MLLIPAIEWNKRIITGATTLASPTVTGIADTTLIIVGNVLESAFFAYNSRVVSKTVDSITMDSNALSTSASFTGDFYNRYDFEYPPTTDNEEVTKIEKRTATSLSGKRQTVVDYIELERDLTFGFITPADRAILLSLYEDFLGLGEKIRYFQDKEINSSVLYEDNGNNFSQTRQAKKLGSFLYEIGFKLRRVK